MDLSSLLSSLLSGGELVPTLITIGVLYALKRFGINVVTPAPTPNPVPVPVNPAPVTPADPLPHSHPLLDSILPFLPPDFQKRLKAALELFDKIKA